MEYAGPEGQNLNMRVEKELFVDPEQTFVIDRFRAEDAPGIASLYLAVYGPAYPFDTYYIPEKLIEANRCGDIHSVVARTPQGDIVAHGAMYKSAPHYNNLLEIGQYLVLKDYRTTFAAFRINEYVAGELLRRVCPDGIFGEAVCNHIITQKSTRLAGLSETALEVGLMPQEVYIKENEAVDRISCIMFFRSWKDRPREIFIPDAYREQAAFILADLGMNLILGPEGRTAPRRGTATVMDTVFIEFAGVGRVNLVAVGTDFPARLSAFEADMDTRNAAVRQVFINLSDPSGTTAVQMLRERGYFFGGLLPRWFDTDGILMQKLLKLPDFSTIRLHSKKAKTIGEMVAADARNCASRTGPEI
ncbi:hypothetical protein [Desulfobacter sp.]|uniref:hypothetical protein n=1 Tax=Desulfobacter sp. TaxID=2294 RepID=UPI003D116171